MSVEITPRSQECHVHIASRDPVLVPVLEHNPAHEFTLNFVLFQGVIVSLALYPDLVQAVAVIVDESGKVKELFADARGMRHRCNGMPHPN